MTRSLYRVAPLLALVLLALPARAQLTQKPALTLDGARRVAEAGAAYARQHGAAGAIAVVDDGGNLMYLERLDGTFAAGARISVGKARTAALFRRPTAFFEDLVNNGRTTMVALEDFTPLQGGVPIMVDGHIVGAVGVSGANSAAQDTEIAEFAASALQATAGAGGGVPGAASTGVTYFSSAEVRDAFAVGRPLLEVDGYKVHASHRSQPGMVEVHTLDTDIVYVVEGTATLVTGGEVVDGQEVAPNEIRGASIRGGETRRLQPGDVIVVPNGVPHWFREVSDPFNYFVVKAN